MTKEEAIKHLHTYSSINGSGITTQDQHEEAKKMAIKALETQPGWIPCSERLPEESDGTVLVCFPDEFPYSNKEPYINAKHNQRVKTASYSQFNKTWYIGDFDAIGEVRPIAWMLLPTPYREGGQDEQN